MGGGHDIVTDCFRQISRIFGASSSQSYSNSFNVFVGLVPMLFLVRSSNGDGIVGVFVYCNVSVSL